LRACMGYPTKYLKKNGRNSKPVWGGDVTRGKKKTGAQARKNNRKIQKKRNL